MVKLWSKADLKLGTCHTLGYGIGILRAASLKALTQGRDGRGLDEDTDSLIAIHTLDINTPLDIDVEHDVVTAIGYARYLTAKHFTAVVLYPLGNPMTVHTASLSPTYSFARST